MSTIVAIDWGAKRTGLAVTDPLKIIASPLSTVATGELFSYLDNYLKTESIERFILGMPGFLKGEETDSTTSITKFKAKLEKRYPSIPVTLVDESHSSSEAVQAMIQSGIKKSERRKKENLDKISAAIILQRYLQES